MDPQNLQSNQKRGCIFFCNKFQAVIFCSLHVDLFLKKYAVYSLNKAKKIGLLFNVYLQQ